MMMSNRRAYSRRIATVRPDNGFAPRSISSFNNSKKEMLAEGGFVL
jgi:hypothetical protein